MLGHWGLRSWPRTSADLACRAFWKTNIFQNRHSWLGVKVGFGKRPCSQTNVIATVAAGDRKSGAMRRTLRAIHPHGCGGRSEASRTDTKLRENTSRLSPNAGVTATRRLSSEYQSPRAGP